MEFLGVGPLELLLVVVIALVVIPPKDLGRAGRALGRFLNRMYRSDTWRLFRQASTELQNLPNRLAREAQLEELRAIEKEMALPDLRSQDFAPWTRPAGGSEAQRGVAPSAAPPTEGPAPSAEAPGQEAPPPPAT